MKCAVVAIGGGHGLATVLESLVGECESLTGVVSVADDGGSSGRLRRDLGIVAPGDMRRCLAALVPPGLIREALEHRFASGALAGHPAGNVLLASMLELEPDPVVVMDALASMVGARGRVLPATSERVDLLATAERGTVKGQVAISESGAIDSIRFSPADPGVPTVVTEAIRSATAIIVGPGSLYTSVLAPIVPQVLAAINERRGQLIYVANLTGEPGETDDYDLDDHINAVTRHGLAPDVVLADRGDSSSSAYESIVRRVDLASRDGQLHELVKLGAALLPLCERSEQKPRF